METPEQRRERLDNALWEMLAESPCGKPCWADDARLSPSGCACVIAITETIIASDEAAGMIVVPVDEIERLRIGSRALRDQFRDGNKYDAAAKEST